MDCSTLSDERGTMPGRRFKDRFTEAPRLQVIGFDLPATEAGKSDLALDAADDGDDGFGADATPKNTNFSTETSPRSALQQLLLPTVAHSDPAPPFPAQNTVSLSHDPSLLPPAAKQMTVEMAALTSKPYSTVVGRTPTNPVTALNWPASKGIAELITRPSVHSSSIHDRHRDCPPPVVVVGKLNSVMNIGRRSCQPLAEAHSSKSERKWDANSQLPEESKKSIGMEGDVMASPCGVGSWTGVKTNFLEIDAKQSNIHILDKSKKISLFILTASSPIAEYGDQCFHGHGADQYKSEGVDMEFLNSCHLCKRSLGHGLDIFMYSGDKAFCSMECRHQQMVVDERKERRTPLVIRAGASPAYRSYMTSPTGNAIIDQTGAATPISIGRPNFMNPAAAA